MSRSFSRGSWLARSSFLILIAAGAAACSSSGSGSPSSTDDGGPDSTAESGSGSDDGSSSDGTASDGPGTGADASDAGSDSPGSASDASSDSASGHQDGGTLDASTDAPSSSDAPTDGTSSETGTPPADASTDAVQDAPVESAAEASVDAPADASPDASGPVIRLFDGHSPGGALGGRAGIDALCVTASQADGAPGFAHVHGFITVTDTDEIKDMPVSYGVPTNGPIESMTGVRIASDWAHLLGGSIDNALTSASVILSGNFWYSGSNADGSIATLPVDGGGVHPLTCSGWTDGSTLFDASYGLAYSTNSNWLSTGSQATCGLSGYRVLCLGW